MVSLSDIPCVGEIVGRISKYIVDGLFRGSSYLLCTNNLVKELNSQIKEVENLENEFTRKVNEAKSDGKIIKAHVLEWQKEVENIKTQASDISGQGTSSTCFRGLHFPNPVARFRLGWRAADLKKTVIEEITSGKEHLGMEIAYYPPTEPVPNSDTPYQRFDSRQEAYAKLWDSIVKEDGSTVLGIYGMAGAGKTRMMEQIREEAKEKGIFKKVTQANIGQTIDVIKLQGDIAGLLDCDLTSAVSIEARATRLRTSLNSGVKTLVILDDVWDGNINLNVIGIPTNEIGIPFTDETSKGCKILLTSRIKDVCLLYKCEDPIEIKPLTDTEGWEMFMNTVGKSKIESFKDTMLAGNVFKQCGCLPLLILPVGKSLRLGDESAWRDALYQLENPKFEDINRIDQKAYSCLQLSFLKLEEGAKRCLLLCGLFPEDADINTKLLFDIATASELLMPGRDIHALVKALKSASLLLQGKDDDTVKVHDIVRDVARYIAALDPEYAFLFVRCQSTRWPKNGGYPYPSRKLLHVDLEVNNVQFHHLVCKDLHTLWLQCNNHLQNRLSSFFEGFSKLKVVVLQGMRLSEQQFSIHTLEELTMLTLEHCDIDQIFLNSVSKTLETLCIWKCSLPVPLDIPEFKDLRKLELVSNHYQALVVCGISKVTSLEELTIPSGFKTKEDEYTSISAELSTLNCLRKLIITFLESESCPSHILDNLVDFKIVVGDIHEDYWWLSSERRAIHIDGTDMESRWMPLLERAEVVTVKLVFKGLPDIGLSEGCNMREREAFANLRSLEMNYCDGMEHIARWDGRSQHLTCFTNLQTLRLRRCIGMEYAFSSRVANCLVQLQTLTIGSCHQIKEIVRVDDGQDIICFPKLTLLLLEYLPKLTSLYNNQVEFPQLRILKVTACPYLETVIRCAMLHGFQNLEFMGIWNCDRLRSIHHSSPAESTMVFPALKELWLESLPALSAVVADNCAISSLFTCSVFRNLHNLTSLRVEKCNMLEQILADVDDMDHDETPGPSEKLISLPLLKSIQLKDLNGLKSFSGCSNFTFSMPALKDIMVYGCPCVDKFAFSQIRAPLIGGDLNDYICDGE